MAATATSKALRTLADISLTGAPYPFGILIPWPRCQRSILVA
jgi:hypothetical protein